MIKMIVSDLDGTLLHDDKTISPYTYHILQKLKQKNVLFVTATARPKRAVHFFDQVAIDACIYHNGALIYNQDRLLDHIGIDHAVSMIQRILFKYPHAHICMEANDQLYANFKADNIWKGEDYLPTDFTNMPEIVADKVIIEAHSLSEMQPYEEFLDEHLYMQLSENKIAMIMNKQARKINAISLVAKQYGITLDEIIAFGDDYNDLEMLKQCQKGIAVENALDEVKKVADECCLSNQQDGVAHWLEENVLK